MRLLTLTFISTILFFAIVAFGGPVEVQLKNGTSIQLVIGQTVTVEWKERGTRKNIEGELTTATSDYIVVDGELILIENIISIQGDGNSQTPEPDVTSVNNTDDTTNDDTPITPANNVVATSEGELARGVFVLPWKGMVGDSFRCTELRRLIDHIETKYGLGQIIVVEINSTGGAVSEWSEIRDVIFEAKERHRIIAWIEHAGSGAAATAFTMDEIYYRTYGTLGSITMYSGGDLENVSDDDLIPWISELKGVLAKSSWTPLVAGSMVKSSVAFSYDIDSLTGEITHYDNMSGMHILSRDDQNNMLSHEEALTCGLSDGSADTGEELAELLNLDEWIEIDQFGREIAAKWWKTLDDWNEGQQDLMKRVQGDVEGKTEKQRILNHIKAIEELMRWKKRLGETADYASKNWLADENMPNLRAQILRLKQQLQYADE